MLPAVAAKSRPGLKAGSLRRFFAPFDVPPRYRSGTEPVRPFFSSSSVVLQCRTEELLKNY